MLYKPRDAASRVILHSESVKLFIWNSLLLQFISFFLRLAAMPLLAQIEEKYSDKRLVFGAPCATVTCVKDCVAFFLGVSIFNIRPCEILIEHILLVISYCNGYIFNKGSLTLLMIHLFQH